MKKTIRTLLAALVCLLFCTALAQPGKAAHSYRVGDVVRFGSYPQSLVTDKALIQALIKASSPASRKTYPYYSRNTGANSRNFPAAKDYDIMKYQDFTYNGDKYRAVFLGH